MSQVRLNALNTQLRAYDAGFQAWLRDGLPVKEDGKPIPVVVATPDRAFAAMQHLLYGERAAPVKDIKNIPLPFVSISPGAIQFDQLRWQGRVRLILGRNADSSATYTMQWPLPFNISYKIEFWSKNVETMNALKLWSSIQFDQGIEAFVHFDLSSIWPTWKAKLIPLLHEGFQDLSDLEPDEGQRVVRGSLSVTAKAWISTGYESVKNILKVFTDVYIADTNADLTVGGAVVEATPDTYEPQFRVTTDKDGETVGPIP